MKACNFCNDLFLEIPSATRNSNIIAWTQLIGIHGIDLVMWYWFGNTFRRGRLARINLLVRFDTQLPIVVFYIILIYVRAWILDYNQSFR